MTQKQIFSVVAGVAVVALIFVFVYRQFSPGASTGNMTAPTKVTLPKDPVAMSEKPVVPDTIDGVAGSIVAEPVDDASALDDELSDSFDQVDQDSDSVNNFGTSYDENSL